MKIINQQTSETFQYLVSGDCFKVIDNSIIADCIFMKVDSLEGNKNSVNLTNNRIWTTMNDVRVIKLPNATLTY